MHHYVNGKIVPGGRGVPLKLLRIMNLLAIFLLAACLQVSAAAYSQKVAISGRHLSMGEVLRTVEKQTGLQSIFDPALIKQVPPITLHVSGYDLTDLLNLCLRDQPITYEIRYNTIVFKRKGSPSAEPQAPLPPEIHGRVLNEKGEPLAAASVTIKGKRKVVATDDNGEFTIRADSNDVLIISLVGYGAQQVRAGNGSMLSIRLTPVIAEEQAMIVVGYGAQQQAKITGAVTTVSGDELRKTFVPNNTSGLAGKVPGLISLQQSGHPGSGATISIRGVSSINDAPALFVVDGTIRNYTNFDELDPNDIESISILKDAGAAAVYGVRSTNGVIVVTTKRGKLGKPIFSMNSNVSFDKPTQYPKVFDAWQYATYQKAAAENLGLTPLYSDPQIAEFKSGQLPSTNWQKVAYGDHATTNMNNLNVSGGSDAVKYFFSFGYMDQSGIYPNVRYNRYNFRTNLDVKVNKTLTATVGLEGKVSDMSNPSLVNNSNPSSPNQPGDFDYALWSLANNNLPTVPAYYSDGLPRYDISFSEHAGAMSKESGYNKTNDNLFVGSLGLAQQIPFVKGLTAKSNIQVWREYTYQKVWNLAYNTYVEDSTGAVADVKTLNGPISLFEQMAPANSYTLDLSLDYARVFGQHSFKGLLLYEQYQAEYNTLNASRTDYPFTSVDQLFAGGNDSTRTNYGTASQDGRLSVVGRLDYDYASKYLFEASFRDDASYRFAPNKRWGLFPSFSAGWIISREDFMARFHDLDFLKLRGSWGILGNDLTGGFQWKDSYQLSSSPYFLAPGTTPVQYLSPSNVPNPNLTWESTATTNIGIDASFFQRLLGFQLDFFQKNTYNVYYQRNNQYPGVYGATLPAENYGKVDTRGWELKVTHERRIGDFRYSVDANVSFSRNKVVQIDFAPNVAPWTNPIGKPINYTTGFVSTGLIRSDKAASAIPFFGIQPAAGDIGYADLNHDGVIDQRDSAVLSWHTNTPEIMYGFNFNAAWKGISFNIFFQGAANRNVLLSDYTRNGLLNGNSYAYFMDFWSPSNPGAKYPRAWIGRSQNNDVSSSFCLKNADFLRLKNVQLAYELPRRLVQGWKVSSIRLYISGTNLAVFSPIKDFDPEYPGGSGFYYPQNKSMVIGANVSF